MFEVETNYMVHLKQNTTTKNGVAISKKVSSNIIFLHYYSHFRLKFFMFIDKYVRSLTYAFLSEIFTTHHIILYNVNYFLYISIIRYT